MIDIQNLTQAEAPPKMHWIYPDILPLGELVLLDGATGVGKSAFIAHLASHASRQTYQEGVKHVLYVSSKFQRDIRNFHLKNHDACLDNIHEVKFDASPFYTKVGQPPSPITLLSQLVIFLEVAILEHKPSLVVLDSLEEILHFCDEPAMNDWRHFFHMLIVFTCNHDCTILLPRLHGMHEGRHYGPARIGTEMARHILTLHWHPHHSDKRVLTAAKSYKSPMGLQWHLDLDHQGTMTSRFKEVHEHVRPAKSPQTWHADTEHLHETKEIYAHVREKMQGRIIKKQDLCDYIMSLGYSERAFIRTMSKAKLDAVRRGADWYYAPTVSMRWELALNMFAEQQARAAAAAGDGSPQVELKTAG